MMMISRATGKRPIRKGDDKGTSSMTKRIRPQQIVGSSERVEPERPTETLTPTKLVSEIPHVLSVLRRLGPEVVELQNAMDDS